MKKTERNQNMPDQRLRNDESMNTGSLMKKNKRSGENEHYSDANLDQPATRNTKQRYDDMTGTVENGIH
jgi:hypothetical protein